MQTSVLLPTKPSCDDDDSEFMHGFGAKPSLSLTQSVPSSTARYHQALLVCRHCVGIPYPC